MSGMKDLHDGDNEDNDGPSDRRPSISMSVDDLDFGDGGVFDEWLVGNTNDDGRLLSG